MGDAKTHELWDIHCFLAVNYRFKMKFSSIQNIRRLAYILTYIKELAMVR